jgi:hypothetical protein
MLNLTLTKNYLPIKGIPEFPVGSKSFKSNSSKKKATNKFIPSIVFAGDSGGIQKTTCEHKY